MGNDLTTAAQQALEALEALQGGCTDHDDGTIEAITVWCPEIIDALRAALAEPEPPIGKASTDVGVPVYVLKKAEPVQEPVAWMHVPYPGNAISPMLSLSKHREPSLYAATVPLYIKEQL